MTEPQVTPGARIAAAIDILETLASGTAGG